MLTAQEIRQRYLHFFERHKHEIVESGPLIPPNDKTLLFTNAGMVQFKKLFLGAEKLAYTRATTCQKCLRVSGKHNDLENVGRTARHHTFFEMLGNFSFGDYFKREAITWAWEFVTQELLLPKEKLWVTIYREDEEANALWQEIAHLSEDRIVRMGEHDNFWTMGDTGPCGPCSEIYIDQGSDMACGPNCGIGKCDCDRFLEIWNLVFTQFDQAADGSRTLLAAPNIDTGMGLERIAAVCQGKRSNFDCDLFQDLIQHAAQLAHVEYHFSDPNTNDVDTALRVIADHSRAAAFLIAEGVLPSNESRGYVLRRLIRRALRFAELMGVHEPFMYKVVERVIEVMGEAYPELRAQSDLITRAVHEEEMRFSETLENGLKLLETEMDALRKEGKTEIPGSLSFLLHDTHGFPLDIVNDVAEKNGFTVDTKGFEENMAKQRERARANQKKSGLLGQDGNEFDEICKRIAARGITSQFVGYTTLSAESEVILLLDSFGSECDILGEGDRGFVVTRETPFYGESGGQVGDKGVLSSFSCHADVLSTRKPAQGLILEEVEIASGEIRKGERVQLEVSKEFRMACARNHSCTHLLHAALRSVLGNHVHQMGSLVDDTRLRFDFSHLAPMIKEEIDSVEKKVNSAILSDLEVVTKEMSLEDAEKTGAMALFDEKYGDVVRVVCMGDEKSPESLELCGGTHLQHTGEAGLFMIVSEEGVASGTRRIEAVTGWNALQLVHEQRRILASAQSELKVSMENVPERIAALQKETKKLRKEAEKSQVQTLNAQELARKKETIGNVSFLTLTLNALPMKAMRSLMDELRSLLSKESVVLLASEMDGKASLLLYVSKDLHSRFTAQSLIGDVAQCVDGSGGGRPDLAQAGGNSPKGINAAFARLKACVEKQ